MSDNSCSDCGASYASEDAHPDHPGLCARCASDHDATMGIAIVETHGPRGWHHDGSVEQEASERRRGR